MNTLKIEGVDFHRHTFRTAEWVGGIIFLALMGTCVWKGIMAERVSMYLSIGMNAYILGRSLYKRGRSMLAGGLNRGEFHALAVQYLWNGTVLLMGQQTAEQTAMWLGIGYSAFCLSRGIAKQRTGSA